MTKSEQKRQMTKMSSEIKLIDESCNFALIKVF